MTSPAGSWVMRAYEVWYWLCQLALGDIVASGDGCSVFFLVLAVSHPGPIEKAMWGRGAQDGRPQLMAGSALGDLGSRPAGQGARPRGTPPQGCAAAELDTMCWFLWVAGVASLSHWTGPRVSSEPQHSTPGPLSPLVPVSLKPYDLRALTQVLASTSCVF